MKKILIFLSIVLLAISCSNGNEKNAINPEVIYGRWIITKELVVNGNSQSFQENNSGIFFDFDINGTVVTNSSSCNSSSFQNSRTFNSDEKTITCANSSLSYELTNSELIITIPCNTNCKQVFEKVSDF